MWIKHCKPLQWKSHLQRKPTEGCELSRGKHRGVRTPWGTILTLGTKTVKSGHIWRKKRTCLLPISLRNILGRRGWFVNIWDPALMETIKLCRKNWGERLFQTKACNPLKLSFSLWKVCVTFVLFITISISIILVCYLWNLSSFIMHWFVFTINKSECWAVILELILSWIKQAGVCIVFPWE